MVVVVAPSNFSQLLISSEHFGHLSFAVIDLELWKRMRSCFVRELKLPYLHSKELLDLVRQSDSSFGCDGMNGCWTASFVNIPGTVIETNEDHQS